MKKITSLLLSALFTTTAFAGGIKVDQCWKGFSNAEQKSNLAECHQQESDPKKCSDNLWEHGHGAFDVCLIEADGPMKIVETFKGGSQSEQNENLAKCKANLDHFQFCISNLWIHKQGAYDVCKMEVE